MAFRVHNLGTLRVPSSSAPASTEHKELTLTGSLQTLIDSTKEGTVTVPPGTYSTESKINVPSGINLVAYGDVIIKGNLNLLGNGLVSGLECSGILTMKSGSNRTLRHCTIGRLIIEDNSYGKLNDVQIEDNKLTIIDSQLLIQNCTLSISIGDVLESLGNTVIMVENSNIQGSIVLKGTSVLDCKHVNLVEMNGVSIIDAQDAETNVQLFNCYITGTGQYIKYGVGSCVVSNLINLGTATQFNGGENTVIN